MNSAKVVLGLLAGFAAGALLGMAFAPKKVKRHEYSGTAEQEFDDFIDESTEKFDKLMDDIGHRKTE
jgi:gas vesicle protein